MPKALLTILLLLIVLVIANNKWYLKNKAYSLNSSQTVLLKHLGDSALIHGDIPIAAILVYNNNILGTGYNDVYAHSNISGHAEINALNNAIHHIGLDSFSKLDREKLILITTWEPCGMCSGAIVQYNIRHVATVKTKSLKLRWQQWKKKLRYEWNQQTTSPDTLQDHLFKKHPQYEKQKANL